MVVALVALVLAGCGGDAGAPRAPATVEVTVEEFAAAYADLDQRLSERIEELEAKWEAALDRGQADEMRAVAADFRDILGAGHEELTRYAVPAAIRGEHEAAIRALGEYQRAWRDLARTLERGDIARLGTSVEAVGTAAQEWQSARDALRQALEGF